MIKTHFLTFALLCGLLFYAQNGLAQNQGLLIKQIYYAGSGKEAGGIRDQFIEIYNNSDKIIYLDGLYISLVTGARINPGTELSEDAARSIKDFAVFADGRFDWTQSYGMPDDMDANGKYVYASNIYRIPGSGKDCPLLPGKSIVVAQNALNFKEPYTRYDGVAYNPEHPERALDLSQADFETNHTSLNGRDQDNPAVPDLEIVRSSIRIDMMMDWFGKEAVIIYRYPGDITALPTYTAPLKGKVKSTNAAHLAYPFTQIPITHILDAVEVQPKGAPYPKRLSAELDAGYAGTDIEKDSGMSVIRKTMGIKKGRAILQDTNNSAEDFITVKANPHLIYPVKK